MPPAQTPPSASQGLVVSGAQAAALNQMVLADHQPAAPTRQLVARALAELVVDGAMSWADADRVLTAAGMIPHSGQRSGVPTMCVGNARRPRPYRRTPRCTKH